MHCFCCQFVLFCLCISYIYIYFYLQLKIYHSIIQKNIYIYINIIFILLQRKLGKCFQVAGRILRCSTQDL